MAEPGATFDNRIDSVGQLFQADQQTFVYNAAAAPSQVPLFASLRQIDRAYQLDQLAEAIETARAAQRQTPLVVLVEGTAEDELVSFVQRVGEHDLAAEMLLPCDYLGLFDWPERSFQRLMTRLISAMARAREAPMPVRSAAQDALVELIANHDRSIVFAHQLDPELCQARPDLVKAWTSIVADACRNPASGLLVCFLCVEVCDPQRDACRRLVEELQGLAVAHDWCVLETMLPVERRHVEDWIDLYNVKPALADLAYISPALAKAVFEPEPKLRYRRAVEGLLSVIEPQLRPFRQRWAA